MFPVGTIPAWCDEMGKRSDKIRKAYTPLAALGTLCASIVAVCFFFYPGAVLVGLARDPGIHSDGQPTAFSAWFQKTARRYRVWADEYLASRQGEHVAPGDVAGTEWPLFGTVFFLAAAEELLKQGKIKRDGELMATLEVAARVVVATSTASWVRAKWGENYQSTENVFYRVLVLHGLTNFERATFDTRYHIIQQQQARLLGAELMAAKYHLADDYPGSGGCSPNPIRRHSLCWLSSARILRAFEQTIRERPRRHNLTLCALERHRASSSADLAESRQTLRTCVTLRARRMIQHLLAERPVPAFDVRGRIGCTLRDRYRRPLTLSACGHATWRARGC